MCVSIVPGVQIVCSPAITSVLDAIIMSMSSIMLEVTSIWWNGKEIVVVVQGSDLWFRDAGLGML